MYNLCSMLGEFAGCLIFFELGFSSRGMQEKKFSTQGRIFELRPLDLPILYVVVNSHALGGKFPHLAVHFQIFEFSLFFFHEV
jgi:hypothetical protein